jgi:hypothetical protein
MHLLFSNHRSASGDGVWPRTGDGVWPLTCDKQPLRGLTAD